MTSKQTLVCVIDDDESVRRAFKLLLQSAGFDVRIFASAREFLEALESSENCVIVMDMRMPGMTGLDLLKELRSGKTGQKIIAVSGYDDAPTRELSEELGVVAFFRKPVDDQALIDTIEWVTRHEKR
jgi:two-component system, LuxR family, response regulator FixJ